MSELPPGWDEYTPVITETAQRRLEEIRRLRDEVARLSRALDESKRHNKANRQDRWRSRQKGRDNAVLAARVERLADALAGVRDAHSLHENSDICPICVALGYGAGELLPDE